MIIKRLKAAMRTNKLQATVILGFTGWMMVGFFMLPDHPFWLGLGCFFCWPVLAFVINLINPLPEIKPYPNTGDET